MGGGDRREKLQPFAPLNWDVIMTMCNESSIYHPQVSVKKVAISSSM